MLADEVIAEIRDRTDIVALIGEYVELKQRGANFVGLCPFHSEKTPSFNVRRDRQFFHCFGCQESGDALGFLMRLEGITFPQAARALAERAGVTIPETFDPEQVQRRREQQRLERLLAITEAAAEFYVQQLRQHPARAKALEALRGRQIDESSVAAFRLGYAPAGWDALCTHLQRCGLSLEDAEALGLVIARRDRRGHYDRFRHRLMFPISDIHGRVVAFSGRALPQIEPQARANEEPKYVNSPESALYKKGELLFGLHQARVEVRRNGWAILCEGNFDLVALHQAGFRNAVAPLGTAFTLAQARLLRRFAQRVTLLFDGDAAGLKAVRAAYPLAREVELTARVVALPQGSDPDSYLRAHGAAALSQLIDAGSGIVEHLIDASAHQCGTGAAERADAIAALGPILAAAGNPVEIELYVQRIAQRFSVADPNVVKEQLRRGVRSQRRATDGSPLTTKVASAAQRVKLPQLQSELQMQSKLLGALLDKPALFRCEYAENVKELLTAAQLQDIFCAAAAQVAERGTLDAPRLLGQLGDNAAIVWLRERLSVETYSDEAQAQEVLRRGIPLLAKQDIERKLPQLAQQIQEARKRGDEQEAIRITRQRQELALRAHQLVKGVKR